eukprot:TRINITY_DN4326_c0_g1_i2.p1 TRINITY_DN4326_c0_g1~~TRINITY_DN4326_c0_g1_i2.p1  ORF type:complete len:782 (+),score=253.04 TRINITY_DN4326_c0_g1_i2:1027-3372(+)
MAKAYALNPLNAVALLTLADYFFFNDDLDKSSTLASKALEVTRSRKISAAANCRLAQIAHHREDMEAAFAAYTNAAKQDQSSVRPLFGLAQCHIWRKQLGHAVQCLEKVLEMAPRSWEPKRLLGILYSRIDKPQVRKSLQLLKQVLEVQPDDTDTLIEICELQVQQDTADAKLALEKLKKVPSENIPVEFWNNLGAMLHKLGEPEQALDAYRKALPAETLTEDDTLGVDPSQLAQSPEQITVLYNIARCWEQLGENTKAHGLYQKLLDGQPLYIDAYIRLCELDSDEKWLHVALEQEPKNSVTKLQLGTLALNRREWSAAQKQFDDCIKSDKSDMYALLSLGNVYLHSWKDEKALNLALDFYLRALKKQPNNAFATHGISCVLAEKGWFVEAKEMLDMLHESKLDSADVLVNLGHVNLQLGNLKAATKAYEKALKFIMANGSTATSDDNSIRLHLSRCLLASKDFEGAIEILQGAVEPDILVKFNVAVVMHAHTKQVFTAAEPDDGDAQAAYQHVQSAKAKFEELLGHTEELKAKKQRVPFTSEDVKTYITKCQLLEDTWSDVESKANARKAAREESWRLQAEKAEVLKAARLKEQEEKDEAAKARLEMLNTLANEEQTKFDEVRANWEHEQQMALRAEQEKQENKQKRKKKEDRLEVVEELPAYLSGEDELEAQLSSSDDEKAPEEYPSLFGDDDEKDAAPAEAQPKKKRLLKKRARSDEESGREDDAAAGEEQEAAASGAEGSAEAVRAEAEAEAEEPATEPDRKRGKRQLMMDSDDDE